MVYICEGVLLIGGFMALKKCEKLWFCFKKASVITIRLILNYKILKKYDSRTINIFEKYNFFYFLGTLVKYRNSKSMIMERMHCRMLGI